MPRRKLTVAAVDKMRAHPTKRIEVPDGVVSGLYLMITPKGVKAWVVRYRHRGRPRKLTLGRYPTIELVDARRKARAALEVVEVGEDPAGARQDRRAPVAAPDTVASAVEAYTDRYLKRNVKRWREAKRLLDLHVVPAIGDVALDNLSRWEIRQLLDDIIDADKPVQANRVLAAIKAMLNWCMQEEIIDVNPVAPMRKPTKERARDRVLTDDELGAVIAGCDGLGYPGGPLIKMLALTGQRRDEVRCIRWSEIDVDRALWTLPSDRSKNHRAHLVPLAGPVMDLLEGLPRFKGDYVFSATSGATPYSNLIKPKRTLDKASGVSGWVLHDLRRTAASGMGLLEIPGETIARVLNHSEGSIAGITARYDRAQRTAAKRRALEAWAQHVMQLLDPANGKCRAASRLTVE